MGFLAPLFILGLSSTPGVEAVPGALLATVDIYAAIAGDALLSSAVDGLPVLQNALSGDLASQSALSGDIVTEPAMAITTITGNP